MGGWAAACWAARSSALRPAAMVGQKGGGRRCAGRSAPRGHAHCRRAATPSRFAGDGLCGWPPPWHRRLGSSRAAPGNARGCADARRSGQAGANRPWFDPTAHSQRVTPVLTGPSRRKPLYANRHRPTKRLNYGFQTGRGLDGQIYSTVIIVQRSGAAGDRHHSLRCGAGLAVFVVSPPGAVRPLLRRLGGRSRYRVARLWPKVMGFAPLNPSYVLPQRAFREAGGEFMSIK